MTAPADRDLILRARRGETEAYGELVARHQTNVFNVCYRMLHNRHDAEDLAQEAFIRALDRLHTFDPEREFGPWIRRVATNLCLNHLEAQKPTAPLDEERDEDKTQSPGEQARSKKEANKSAPPSHPCRRVIASSSSCGIIRTYPTTKLQKNSACPSAT